MSRHPQRGPQRFLNKLLAQEGYIRSIDGQRLMSIDLSATYDGVGLGHTRSSHVYIRRFDPDWGQFKPGLLSGYVTTNPGGADVDIHYSDLYYYSGRGNFGYIPAGSIRMPDAHAANPRVIVFQGSDPTVPDPDHGPGDGSVVLNNGNPAASPVHPGLTDPGHVELFTIWQAARGGGGAGTGGENFYGIESFGGHFDAVPEENAYPIGINTTRFQRYRKILYTTVAATSGAPLDPVGELYLPFHIRNDVLVKLIADIFAAKSTAGFGEHFGDIDTVDLQTWPDILGGHTYTAIYTGRQYNALDYWLESGSHVFKLEATSNDANNYQIISGSTSRQSSICVEIPKY